MMQTNVATELNKKLLDLMILHSLEESQHSVSFYENQLNYKKELLSLLLDEEPCKLFKKSYAKWQQKVDELEKEIESSETKLYEEYCSIGECLELINK